MAVTESANSMKASGHMEMFEVVSICMDHSDIPALGWHTVKGWSHRSMSGSEFSWMERRWVVISLVDE